MGSIYVRDIGDKFLRQMNVMAAEEGLTRKALVIKAIKDYMKNKKGA